MVYVYIIVNSAKTFKYVGLTDDINKRVAEHNQGLSIATKGYQPLELKWYCAFPSRSEAAQFENYLKSGSGRAFTQRHLVQ
ncbi:MAG: GIY-YIG nuclease family protein [Candidatus Kerfeldbacteria bacterium]|nr:GIY-YIG nuclease family protein [Candidatus Kerfeldbacteria bacterium]